MASSSASESDVTPMVIIANKIAEEMICWARSNLRWPAASSWIRILEITSHASTAAGSVTSAFMRLNDPVCLSQCNWRATCLAPNDEALAAAQARSDLQNQKISVEKADIQSLPYDAGAYTHVLWNLGLQYEQDAAKPLAEIHRVLEDGGKITFSVCCKPRTLESVMSGIPDLEQSSPWTDETDIKTRLAEIGFYSVHFWKVSSKTSGLDTSQVLEGISGLMPHLDPKIFEDHLKSAGRDQTPQELLWQVLIVTATKR